MSARPAGAPYSPDPIPWRQTPKWHWRYWIGYRMRKRNEERYDPHWEYRTYRQHARWVLAMTAGGGDLGSEKANGGTKQPNPNRGQRPADNRGLTGSWTGRQKV